MTGEQCKKCGTVLYLHYGAHCWSCDKPEPELKKVFEFFQVAEYIAQKEGYLIESDQKSRLLGKLSGKDVWRREVLKEIEFPGNDCYISWYISDVHSEESPEDDDVLWQFNQGLIKHFGMQPDDSILLSISW